MPENIRAVIFGCAGPTLTPQECDLFRAVNPLGLILFARNIKTPEQVRTLTADFRACVHRPDAPVLIDQEGGRVQRLKAPYWQELPAVRLYGDTYHHNKIAGEQAVIHHATILAQNLKSADINVDCWPCLDVATCGIHDVLGDRCLSDDPRDVLHLGNLAIETLLKAGITPVVKHIPGYGRAIVDPHRTLPVVGSDLETLTERDFYPFSHVAYPVWGMTAHVIYTALDSDMPATLSPAVIRYIRHKIGFQGPLISDALEMGALQTYGTLPELAVKVLQSGVDAVLHCTGDFDEMRALADVIPPWTHQAATRFEQAGKLL